METHTNAALDGIYGKLGIVGLNGCGELCRDVDRYLLDWRGCNDERESFLIEARCPRFGSGEGKGLILQTVRGHDMFIVVDCFNYGVTFRMYGTTVPMSPDDHFMDLKRIISAVGGKARRLTIIMPMLYEGRQHRRSSRESLDCAIALQELYAMGVSNVVTFDAHDARVQNSVPLGGFENILPAYQMIKALVTTVPDVRINRENIMVISPDEGGMPRSIYYSSVLGLELGMFYKRRDHSVVINGRNPILAHEFLGDNVAGRDVIVVDDVISSGESILDLAVKLHNMGARRIFVFATFGLFYQGLDHFDAAYENGMFTRVFTTNLVYRTPELKARPWYSEVDMSKYLAFVIDTLNHDNSMSELLDSSERIKNLLRDYR